MISNSGSISKIHNHVLCYTHLSHTQRSVQQSILTVHWIWTKECRINALYSSDKELHAHHVIIWFGSIRSHTVPSDKPSGRNSTIVWLELWPQISRSELPYELAIFGSRCSKGCITALQISEFAPNNRISTAPKRRPERYRRGRRNTFRHCLRQQISVRGEYPNKRMKTKSSQQPIMSSGMGEQQSKTSSSILHQGSFSFWQWSCKNIKQTPKYITCFSW